MYAAPVFSGPKTPENGAEDAYLAIIEPGRYIPVLGASEIQKISILEDSHHDA